MKRILGPSLLLLLALAPAARAADSHAVLRFENREVVTLRATMAGSAPAERVAAIERRLEALEEKELGTALGTQPMKFGSQQGVAFYLGKKLLLAIFKGDTDPLSDETLDEVAEGAKVRLAAALKAKAERLSPQAMLRGAVYSLAATVALALGAWGFLALRSWLHSRLAALADEPLGWLVVRGVDMRAQVMQYLRGILSFAWWVLLLLLLYAWTAFVLDQFPYTQPWGAALAQRMWSVVKDLAFGALASIPGLFTVVVIISVAVFITRLLSAFFIGVERGRIHIAGLHPETTSATRRITLTLIWLFAIAFAYPFLPGAGSQAFQGISILAGLMLTLGSAGLVTQAMNGLVLVYSHALAKDEFVKIGEVEGTVTDVGTLSTKILTPENEEVTLPNSLVVSSQIKNYSRLARTQSATVTASVSIGYDAPWRQVEAMLIEAARCTRGIKPQPAPRVLQRSLADFFVVYELIATIEEPRLRPTVMSELLANIQDQFNEYGVQILSPHYMSQPDKAALVPKAKWFAAPAAPKKDGGR
jgi:small-conductance mechanosensitive channel